MGVGQGRVRRRRLRAGFEQQKQVGKVHIAQRKANRRHDHVVHQRLHDRSERRTNDDADREVEHVPAQHECLELLEHGRSWKEVHWI
jgi:hypothetical protein